MANFYSTHIELVWITLNAQLQQNPPQFRQSPANYSQCPAFMSYHLYIYAIHLFDIIALVIDQPWRAINPFRHWRGLPAYLRKRAWLTEPARTFSFLLLTRIKFATFPFPSLLRSGNTATINNRGEPLQIFAQFRQTFPQLSHWRETSAKNWLNEST